MGNFAAKLYGRRSQAPPAHATDSTTLQRIEDTAACAPLPQVCSSQLQACSSSASQLCTRAAHQPGLATQKQSKVNLSIQELSQLLQRRMVQLYHQVVLLESGSTLTAVQQHSQQVFRTNSPDVDSAIQAGGKTVNHMLVESPSGLFLSSFRPCTDPPVQAFHFAEYPDPMQRAHHSVPAKTRSGLYTLLTVLFCYAPTDASVPSLVQPASRRDYLTTCASAMQEGSSASNATTGSTTRARLHTSVRSASVAAITSTVQATAPDARCNSQTASSNTAGYVTLPKAGVELAHFPPTAMLLDSAATMCLQTTVANQLEDKEELPTPALLCTPAVLQLCTAIASWAVVGQFPYPALETGPAPSLLQSTVRYHEIKQKLEKTLATKVECQPVLAAMTPSEHAADAKMDHQGDDMQSVEEQELAAGYDTAASAIEEILADFQHVLVLLGFRVTAGTVTKPCYIPSTAALLQAFQLLHAPSSKSKLTVGARALSKHTHRDSSSSFWEPAVGPEAAKNQQADRVLMKVLEQAVWANLHQLPHDVSVLELRVAQGYGARWHVQGQQVTFRGFLEPQMEDGHQLGWRH